MRDNGDVAVRVRLLGPFSVVSGGRAAGPWPRPSARRLCQLVLVSPGRRVSRDLACEELFPRLEPRAAARSLSKALSMARAALAALGEPDAPPLLEADLTHIWANPAVEVDAPRHEQALRAGLAMAPARNATTCSRPPWPTTASCWPTSRTPTGRRARGSGWRRCARRRGWPWPGTGRRARATRARSRARRLGGLRRARPRLRGGGRRPGPRLPRRGPPGAGGTRLRALPGRPRASSGCGLSPSLEEVYATAAFEARAAPDAGPGAGRAAQDRQRAGRRGGRGGPRRPGGAAAT